MGSAFDLSQHEKVSKKTLKASYKLDEPKEVEFADIKITDPKLMGKTFKKDQRHIKEEFENLADDVEKAMALENALESNGEAELKIECLGKTFTLTRPMISIKKQTKMVHEIKYVPNVIEPSFGIGRIMNAAFQHNFSVRKGNDIEGEEAKSAVGVAAAAATSEGGKKNKKSKKKKKSTKKNDKESLSRGVLSFPPMIAPYKCAILPLSKNDAFEEDVNRIEKSLRAAGLAVRTDSSGSSIGRRYARMDELGVPFGVTVDFDTTKDGTVTIRDRDSAVQIRCKIEDVVNHIQDLIHGKTSFEKLLQRYGAFGGGNVSTE